VGIGAAPHHGRIYAPKPKEFTMAEDAPQQNSIDANVPMTTSGTPTEWEQRRRLVQAIMDSLGQLMEQMDHTAAPSGYSPLGLRRILVETGVTLDMIRARVAHQAFAGGPPEAFWPPMRALLDRFFFPEVGSLVCESLEWDPAYEVFWEPDVRELKALVAGWRQPPAGIPE
jgi:hypothetical protein